MNKKFFYFLILFAFVCSNAVVLAQSRTITGRVSSEEDGGTIPSANIVVKGTSSGTVTDLDGKYSITVSSDDAVLVFSFIGMQTKEIVVGKQTVINASLKTDVRQLKEVVITSFGVQKEKEEIGYSVQEVKGAEIAETNRPNMINALQGRIAGVDVGVTGGSPGASSSIIIRGGTSIGSNNQPLFIVDGVPVDNTTMREGLLLNDAPNRNNDYTNRMADLDPNTIESITVLKGPAAAALYGIDAANGAIVITTKKGKKGAPQINYGFNYSFDRITRFPETQTKFGLGSGGTASNTNLTYWGAEEQAGAARYDNLKEFFGWGNMQNHSLSIGGGTDNITYMLSGNVVRQVGSMPGTGLDRNNLKLSTTAKLSEKLSVTTSISFINSENRKPPITKGDGSIYQRALYWPTTDNMSNWIDANGKLRGVLGDGDDDTFDNPYFSVARNRVTDINNRTILNGSFTYTFTNWLSLIGRAGYDTYVTNGSTIYDAQSWARYPERSVARNVGGVLAEYRQQNRLLNTFLMLKFNKKIGEDFKIDATLGHNMDDRNLRVDSQYGERFLVPDLLSISNTNSATRAVATRGERRRLIGVFAEANFAYKNMLFLTLTGRNDWSSTLPKANNSFFYPSVSTSFVLSEALKMPRDGKISYAKLRLAYAQVGKDALPHQVLPALGEFIRTGGGYNVGVFGPNANIKPETVRSYEAGFDVRFLNDRIGIDFTYYTVRASNQIVQPRLSYASGYILQLVNAGEIENRGIEMMINATPIVKKDFSWSLIGNFALNRNKVISLPGGFPEFYLSDTWLAGAVRAGYVAGQPFSTFTANTFQRSAEGQMLIGANGFPVRNLNYINAGNRQPWFTLGITNTFKYKNFSLSALLDTRFGGDIFNGTDWAMTGIGLSTRTLERNTTKVFEGVLANGEQNAQQVTLGQTNYYNAGGAGLIEEQFIERDIYFLRLRDITLAYSFPKELAEKTKVFRTLQLNLTGNNLWLKSNYSGADPDVNGLNASARGSGAVGFDFFSVAAPISIAVGVKAGF